ncbi:replicative DNA helicase [Mycoplasmopsis gallinarum]|uniref:DNA 5'-3' helicase n=1 Tax=Mycoplasmopsis gallinarum TaxID=29557 RepID=A0A162QI12_9BACT|nr:replicative DNA helicase [Mycoplasmopsis gallinarum]OAB48740.1 Replicative DNA helicase [Mycoplasmopsis gallinarum]
MTEYNSDNLELGAKFVSQLLEEQVLSLVLNYNKNVTEVVEFLTEDDFWFRNNRELFKIFKYIEQNRINQPNGNWIINDDKILKVAAELGYTDSITPDFLKHIYFQWAFQNSLMDYIKDLVEYTNIRRIYLKSYEIISLLDNLNIKNTKLDKTLYVENLRSLIMATDRATEVSAEFKDFREISDEYYEKLQQRRLLEEGQISGLATGYSELDNITQGMHPNELIILGARPAMGKTALALNIALNVAERKDERVILFSFEMSPDQLMSRIYSNIANIPSQKLKKASTLTDDEMLKINAAKRVKIDRLNLYIDDSTNTDLKTLIWKCHRLHKIQPISLIVIDYLQLINVDNNNANRSENRQQEVAKISRSLKLLAKDLNVPILALSQLSRKVEEREDKKPMISDLRESGAIDQDADVIMFLYRESYYKHSNKKSNPDNLYENNFDAGDQVDLLIRKNRSGPTADIPLRFKMSVSRFEDLDDDMRREIYKNDN